MSSEFPPGGANPLPPDSSNPNWAADAVHHDGNDGRNGHGAEPQTFVLQTNGAPPPEISLSDVRRRIQVLVRVVRQRWSLGLLGALAVGVPLAYLVLDRPVDQVALTTVLVQSNVDEILLQGPRDTADRKEETVRNHLSVMDSVTFRRRVAATFAPEESLAIQQPYLEKDQESSPEFLAALVGGLIKVDRERGRPLFTIKAAHRDGSIALLLAGRFSSEFRGYLQEVNREAGGDATSILRHQADVLAAEITRLSDQRREYRKQYNLVTVEENQNMLAQRLSTLNAALSTLRVENVRLGTQIAQAEEDLQRTPTPYDNPVLSGFGNLRNLRIELDQIRNQQEGLASQLGPNHPAMQEANRNIAVVEENIARGFRLAMQDLRGQYVLTQAQLKEMSDELTVAFNQSLELDQLAGGFKRMSEDISAKDKALADILQQIEKTDMEAQRPTQGLRVIDAPMLTAASAMQRIYLLAGVGFASMLFFLGLPLVTFLWSERLSGSMDLEGMFKKVVLGVLPKYTRVAEDDRPHIVRDNVELEHVERYLSLVAQFELSSRRSYPRRILVTSTVPGEGKSMNAANLAATFTRYGRKTVLVDCDFRRPVQQRFHRIEHEDGLLTWASRGFPWTDDLLKAGGPVGLTLLPDGTSLIPAGGVDVQPGHVLVARPVGELFRRLALVYDVVIVDSPPAGVFQDALMLARYCSETIVVVREGRAFSSQLAKMLGDLEKTVAPAAGLVLNVSSLRSVHPSIGSRYGYGKYGYGKDYSNRYRYKAKDAVTSNGRAHKPGLEVAARDVVKK